MIADPTSEEGQIYTSIASAVWNNLENRNNDDDPPIIME